MELERKSTLLDVKDIDTKQGIFTGYFSSFGIVDSYDSVVDTGAFAKTFKEWGPAGKNRIKCAYQHDPFSGLLGKPLKLEEHSFGAYHETKVSQTSYGKDVLLLIEDGVLTEQSFAFETVQDISAAKSPDGKRHLVEVRCYEYGPQTWGANDNTPITGVRASDLVDRMKRLDKHLKNGDLSDGSLVALLTQTMELWGKALKEIETAQPTPAPEVIVVQTPPEASKAAPETGVSQLEKKSFNGVLSLEETISFVWAAVRMRERIPYSDGDGDYARYWLMETYSDTAIIEDGKTGKYFSAPWVMGENGVTVGALTEVQRTYTPVTKSASMATLLRVTTMAQAKSAPEAKAGRRNSTADASDIRMILAKAAGLLDGTDRCAATSELLAAMTQDEMTMCMGLLNSDQQALILTALQPEAEPGKSHSGVSTEGGQVEGPGTTHPDTPAQSLAMRRKRLELLTR